MHIPPFDNDNKPIIDIENNIVPKQFVCFTDGYTYEWGDEDYCDTLWIIHSQFGDPIKPPFGVACNYDDKN